MEQRLRSILEARRDRRPLTAWTRLGMLGVVLSLSVGVAAARTAPPPAAPVEEQASSKQKEAIQAAPAEKAPKDVPKDAAPTAKPVPRVEGESAADAVAIVRERISQYATVPVDPQKLESAAIRGMLRALDDPFSDWAAGRKKTTSRPTPG